MNKQALIGRLIKEFGFTPRKARWDANAQMQGWTTLGYWLIIDKDKEGAR